MRIEDHWLNQRNAAAACGVSVTAFARWRVQPVGRVGRETFYLAADILANRLEHHARRLKQPESDQCTTRAQRLANLALTKAQADGQELKNAELRETLAETELIHWVIQKAGAGIAAHLAGIPAAIKRSCSKLRPSDIAIATREVERCQSVLTRMPEMVDEYLQNPVA
ncbi:MAG: terminase small subunit [Xanthomonadales bacterium]|nr:terminase small subunit [Xanthomonadales bacterium]